MQYKSGKKKIRGLRRKVKRIERWKQRNINLNLDNLKDAERDYVKIRISPFSDLIVTGKYDCNTMNPPHWFKMLILESIIDIFINWEQQLKELKEPYYLKIWLYDPRFMESQIVVALGDCLEFYEKTFERDKDELRFPNEKFVMKRHDIVEFKWEQNIDEYLVFESEFFDDLQYLEHLKTNSYKTTKVILNNKNDNVFHLRKGTVWVGTR